MNDPFRLRVLKQLCKAIEGVHPTDPDFQYQFDLGKFTDEAGRECRRVFRGRDVFGDNDPMPMVSILEDPKPMEANNGSEDQPKTHGKYRLLIQGFVEDDKDDPTDQAHIMCAEVMRAVVLQKANNFDILGLGCKMPCVMKLEIGQPVVRPPDGEIADVAYFFFTVTLSLAENIEKPFD